MKRAGKPTIAISMGDPAGIGPEIVLKALQDPAVRKRAKWVIVGNRIVLQRTAEICGLAVGNIAQQVVEPERAATASGVRFGELSASSGAAAVEYVRIATEMCLKKQAAGMVTAPLNKEAVTMSGIRFSGHTEYIAELCGAKESRMLLAGTRLSVVHVTTHVALRKACELSVDRIVKTVELGSAAMKLRGYASPRIAVCGLNPHAGEHGLFGSEDAEFIVPAIAEARRGGIPCDGPCAPDTIFLSASRGAYDLVVAMYHDQGHIPMKLLDFEETVNVSLGIPIVRTSVDHGTAFDIAGKNLADARNMKAAMHMAAAMSADREGSESEQGQSRKSSR
jgi:4-hydroxythreonine-4-phosphate dehydrogenase